MDHDYKEGYKTGPDAAHIESIAYAGFSDEEAAVLRAYEGNRGKQVMRKVHMMCCSANIPFFR